MNHIRHIIFDLGGVILNIDYQLTVDAFSRLGIADFSRHFSQLAQQDLFDRWETGQCTSAEFLTALQGLAGGDISFDALTDAWNAMLGSLPLRRLQLLQQLSLHYDLFLLSNTNTIHEQAFNKTLEAQCGYRSFAVFFDKVYFSHHIGLRKPDPEAFLYILNENNLRPEHTLFIDDSPQHIAAAAGLGIQTIWLEKGKTIENDIFRPKSANR